jgi:hypothetical protein
MSDPLAPPSRPDSGKPVLFAELLADLAASPTEITVPPPIDAPQPKSIEHKAALESSQHLATKVLTLWGSSDLDLFIRGLFLDSRDGERRGLRSEVAAELVFLAKTNKTLRAIDAVSKLNLSFPEALRLIDEGDEARLVAFQNRTAQSQEPITLVSRHKATEEGFWSSLNLGNILIYLMIAAIVAILLWIVIR